MTTSAVAQLIVLAITLYGMAILEFTHQTKQLRRFIMDNDQAVVDAIADQLDKARTEIVAAIAELEEKAACRGVDLTRLKVAAQQLDDLVPDPVVVEEPTEDTPATDEPVDVPAEDSGA